MNTTSNSPETKVVDPATDGQHDLSSFENQTINGKYVEGGVSVHFNGDNPNGGVDPGTSVSHTG